MQLWRIEEEGFEEAQVSSVGNKYLIGNGYLGVRGTLQEYKNEQLTAINLAGIYDQVGDGWREPLNAPNGLYTYLEFNGKELRLPQTPATTHKIALNFRHSIFERETSWSVGDTNVKIKAERFASYDRQHLLAMKYSITVDQEGECSIYTGIDGRVWDINGPHYDEILFTEQDNSLQVKAITHESKDQVYVCEAISTEFECVEKVVKEDLRILRCLSFKVKAGKAYTFYKWVSVYTSKDTPQYEDVALSLLEEGCKEGYEITLSKHVKEWEKSWKASEVLIAGDDQAMQALNYSIYHLLCIAPRHTDQLSIAARGLSGQTYKGAVFWDTEMFMLDFFLFTDPKVAKTLLKYRIDTLEGAKIKAKQYGYQGAFYAWESQEGGYDACSDYNVTDVFTGRPMRTYFKDKQFHISAAVVYGIMRYVDYTGALDLLKEGGAEVVLECANFYYDLLLRKVNKDEYELHDVIGPDEYHERVNNNAYTNRMAKYVFEAAHRIIKLLPQLGNETADKIKDYYDLEILTNQYVDAAKKIFIPQPDKESGVIEQFDGYFELEDVSLEDLKKRLLNEKEYWGGAYGIAAHTKVIKQADVVTMLNLFSQEYDKDTLLNNWNYYEPRTEHGSSLSACMYSMLACKCDMPQSAYPFFLKSAMSDLIGKGKEWAGLIYIGGTHPASSGGAYMTAIEGFAGIYHENGELKAHPALPDNWTRLEFHINYREELYKVIVKGNQAEIIKIEETKQK
jgi:kojibiose phosphorylase/nigerose phosphorylase